MKLNYDPNLPIEELVLQMKVHAKTGAFYEWNRSESKASAYINNSIAEHWGYGLRIAFLRDKSNKPFSYGLCISRIRNITDYDFQVRQMNVIELFFGSHRDKLWVLPPQLGDDMAFGRYTYSLTVNRWWNPVWSEYTDPRWLPIDDVHDLPNLTCAGEI